MISGIRGFHEYVLPELVLNIQVPTQAVLVEQVPRIKRNALSEVGIDGRERTPAAASTRLGTDSPESPRE